MIQPMKPKTTKAPNADCPLCTFLLGKFDPSSPLHYDPKTGIILDLPRIGHCPIRPIRPIRPTPHPNPELQEESRDHPKTPHRH